MYTHCLSVLELLTVALASGGIAEFLLKTGLSESWVTIGGLLGVAMDRCIPVAWGPTLFGHCLLDCIAASAITMLALWFLHLPLAGGTSVSRHKRSRRTRYQPLRTTSTMSPGRRDSLRVTAL
ncbi:MAG: hypothetical protein ACHQ4J_03435 [Candidatus Binatia bacterium]